MFLEQKLLEVNDFVFLKRDFNHYLGYGIVTSVNFKNPNPFTEFSDTNIFGSYPHLDPLTKSGYSTKIEWKTSEELIGPESKIKGLKNISSDKLFLQSLFMLFGINHPAINNLMSLNRILYGPPGTGKTFNSIKQAVEIIDGNQTNSDYKIRFDELRQKGQIEFVTFHQNYSYEDFVVGIFPDVSAGVLRFDKREGIFKKLVEKAKQNWLLANNSGNNQLDFYSVFNKFFTKLFEEEVNEVEIPMRSKGHKFKITLIDIENGRIKFTKQSGGTGHDLLIRNVEAIYKDELNYGLDGLGVYYYPLNDVLKAFAATIQPQTRNEELKNFVLIIDEINRANISRVFGELITLLEEDKRLGAENELKVTLPNGEKDFGIPPNLYIIGTMNTADKSIALIDIALRRRFEFVGYYPDYKVIQEKRGDETAKFLENLNKAVYEKKQKSADYLIGHAYFLKDEPIEKTLETRVIPLLMEYFSNKTDLVSQLFTETNYTVNYDSTLFKWEISPK